MKKQFTFNGNRWHWQVFLLALLVSTSQTFAQTSKQRQAISKSYNHSKLTQLSRDFSDKAQSRKAEALRMAEQKGWEVVRTNSDGTFDELVAVSNDGSPIYYTVFNVDAARSTRANHLNIGGSLGLDLDGQNMTAHVWDGGPTRPTHQEFDGPGGNNRVIINDGVTTLNGNSFHAQHVTGTIVASGFDADAKGMAPQATALTHDWNSDLSEATTEASNGMLVSNHSYGYAARDFFGNPQLPNYYFGGYIEDSRDWDNLMYNAPYYLMVVAAGNDGNDNTVNGAPLDGNSLYDKLTGHSTSKNNLVVANAQDANIAADGSLISVSINSGSSEGPTDDYRIKPDITGNGTGLYSSYEDHDAHYATISGTSMASPNVTGSLLLLQQHYEIVNGNFMRAATLKGLALHTADDIGSSGPDAIHGWGLLNAKAAAEAISNNGNETIVDELTLSQGQTYTITVDSDGSSPLLASISWTDPAGTATTALNSSNPVLVNDLDIRVSQSSTTYQPYRLTAVNANGTGDNNVDPYERIDVSGASGSYTIEVTHKGSLSGGSQDFTLIVTGVTGTPAVCDATTPTGLSSSNVGTTTATLSWNNVAGATYDVRYRPTGGTWTTAGVSGTSIDLSGLTSETEYEAQVRSKCPDDATSAYSSSVNFTTQAPGSISCSATETLPYSEGFESNDGWTQVSGDDGNWVRDANGTPSSGTGPSSAAEGSYYMFLEASSNGSTGEIGANATAILESNCFDLSGETTATFSFKYHMYGTAIGSLTIQATSDGTNWTDLWTLSGNQGNSWVSESVSLDSYAGGDVKLRIVGTTGSGWSSDIAVDDLSVVAGETSNATLTIVLDNYPEETSWEIRDGSTVIASGGTYGSQPDGSTVVENISLSDGCYDFVMLDSYGDGICCSFGEGSYTLEVGGNTVASGGAFGSSETTNFCVGGENASFAISTSSVGLPVSFDLYPVPAGEYLNIATTRDQVEFKITNLMGQVVAEGEFVDSRVNVSQLKTGIYMIEISSGGKSFITKFVKK
ncbi:S8 family serine peptidase [Xanthovirga aplysinae]|uniref:S8 family serine peptidase n=1 Tax=Xanthovirga aplysinae TaxID=2529853 RepID=UPI0012BBEC99|nr:S8 family serine peptidase [Xanthovirga aplysinae]MTI30693.1 T9SS type A sorting domain-containing protein [Xanthovirga aplysinae]